MDNISPCQKKITLARQGYEHVRISRKCQVIFVLIENSWLTPRTPSGDEQKYIACTLFVFQGFIYLDRNPT